jgi:hypothetical protein
MGGYHKVFGVWWLLLHFQLAILTPTSLLANLSQSYTAKKNLEDIILGYLN